MAITEDEKKCLKEANAFLYEAGKELGFRIGGPSMTDTYVSFASNMLGQLAADKYKSCIQGTSSLSK